MPEKKTTTTTKGDNSDRSPDQAKQGQPGSPSRGEKKGSGSSKSNTGLRESSMSGAGSPGRSQHGQLRDR